MIAPLYAHIHIDIFAPTCEHIPIRFYCIHMRPILREITAHTCASTYINIIAPT